MILIIKKWCENLIYVIFIISLLEIIIQNNSSKKYIRIVMNLLVLIVIISPFKEIDELKSQNIINDLVNNNSSYENSIDIKNVYLESMNVKMKEELNKIDPSITQVKLEYNNDYSQIVKIILYSKSNNINYQGINEFLSENMGIEKIEIEYR